MSGEKMASVEPPEAESKDALEPANSDPASSLRAAALRTLKSKRRKPTDAQSPASLLSRPMAVDNSFQLDYGQEDDIASSPPQAPADRETGQTREEGEISDSEGPDSVAAKPSSRSSLPQHTQTATSVDDNSISTRSSPPRTLKMESPPPTLLDRISDTSARPRRSSASTMTDEGNLSQRSFFIDAEHVRPGLQINQEQYDAAKDIVLDLLGWGVPPEYLVDCGLSREIVYYVFTELNLRFPNNLDITGLVPYNPVTAKSLLRDLNAPPRTSVPRSMGHPSLPPKPVSASQARPPTPPPAIESSQLNDMERQRRQELLARKAVISSRKEKTSASTSPSTNPTATDDQDVEMTPLIPTETVDDFLKSIGSVSDGDKTCEDRMEVDDIPGLTGPSSHSSSLMSTPALPLDTQLLPMDDHSLSAIDLSDSGNPKSRRSSASSEDQNHANGRKATKRPVAADFVDFEGSPRGRHSANGSGTVHPHLKRKLGGSFASVSAMRRCVIDLSDSEGEDDRGDTRPGLPPVVRRMSVPVSSVRSTTPPDTPQSAGAALSRSKSPNALAEKEAEILKMKQLIAERQHLNKLKRMESGGANTPGIVTPLTEEIAGTDLLPTVTDLSSNEKLLSESNVQDVNMLDKVIISTNVTSALSTPIVNNDDPSLPEATQMTPITQDESNSKTDGDQVAIPHNQAQDPPKEAVDVDSVSSPSTQAEMTILQLPQRLAENQEKYDSSSVYSSLFDEYPLLRSRPRPILFDSVSVPLSVQYPHFAHVKDTSSNTVISLSSFSPTSIPSIHTTLSSTSTIDLKPLKLGRLSQSLDASKRICQYEIPGGGVCRDDKCEDLHLNGESRKSAVGVDFRSEPDDQETATFVAAALPDSWTSVYGTTLASRIATALEETRLKNPTMTIEERVARVIAILRPSSSHSTT